MGISKKSKSEEGYPRHRHVIISFYRADNDGKIYVSIARPEQNVEEQEGELELTVNREVPREQTKSKCPARYLGRRVKSTDFNAYLTEMMENYSMRTRNGNAKVS